MAGVRVQNWIGTMKQTALERLGSARSTVVKK
jgi:hypothetical protein